MNERPPELFSDQSLREFQWPCPDCRAWHYAHLVQGVKIGTLVRVRCPRTGRLIERPMAIHRDSPKEPPPRLKKKTLLNRARHWIGPARP